MIEGAQGRRRASANVPHLAREVSVAKMGDAQAEYVRVQSMQQNRIVSTCILATISGSRAKGAAGRAKCCQVLVLSSLHTPNSYRVPHRALEERKNKKCLAVLKGMWRNLRKGKSTKMVRTRSVDHAHAIATSAQRHTVLIQ
jgi:hypothetical protein